MLEADPLHGLPITGVDAVQDAEVDAHAVARVQRVHVGFLRQVGVVGFEAERDEPVTGRLLLDMTSLIDASSEMSRW
nr:hypothetical protein [Halorientalis sp.]